jgi:hypothetical protein
MVKIWSVSVGIYNEEVWLTYLLLDVLAVLVFDFGTLYLSLQRDNKYLITDCSTKYIFMTFCLILIFYFYL